MANLDFSNLVDVDTTQTPTSSQPQASTLDFSNLVDVDTTQPQASTLDFSNLVDVDTTQPTSIIKDEDDLDTSQKWLSNAATIYEAEEGN